MQAPKRVNMSGASHVVTWTKQLLIKHHNTSKSLYPIVHSLYTHKPTAKNKFFHWGQIFKCIYMSLVRLLAHLSGGKGKYLAHLEVMRPRGPPPLLLQPLPSAFPDTERRAASFGPKLHFHKCHGLKGQSHESFIVRFCMKTLLLVLLEMY